jgi:hypothetical protein
MIFSLHLFEHRSTGLRQQGSKPPATTTTPDNLLRFFGWQVLFYSQSEEHVKQNLNSATRKIDVYQEHHFRYFEEKNRQD